MVATLEMLPEETGLGAFKASEIQTAIGEPTSSQKLINEILKENDLPPIKSGSMIYGTDAHYTTGQGSIRLRTV